MKTVDQILSWIDDHVISYEYGVERGVEGKDKMEGAREILEELRQFITDSRWVP